MTEDEVRLADLERENRGLSISLANSERRVTRLEAEKKSERWGTIAIALVVFALIGLIFYWSALGARGAQHQAELETQKSLACIIAGGIWDKDGGSCAWSREVFTFAPEGSSYTPAPDEIPDGDPTMVTTRKYHETSPYTRQESA